MILKLFWVFPVSGTGFGGGGKMGFAGQVKIVCAFKFGGLIAFQQVTWVFVQKIF